MLEVKGSKRVTGTKKVVVANANTNNTTINGAVSIGTLLDDLAQRLTSDTNYAFSLYHYNNKMALLKGGKLRNTSKDLVEKLVYRALHQCAILAGLKKDEYSVVKGDGKNGITLTNSGGSITTGLDWHLSIGDKLVLCVECKTYFDGTRMQLVDWLCGFLKERGTATMSVHMERAAADSTEGFFQARNKLDSSHYLMDGIRRSSKPIYMEEFRKDVLGDRMFTLVTQMYTTIKNNM